MTMLFLRPMICSALAASLLAGCDKEAPPSPPASVAIVVTSVTAYAPTIALTGIVAARVTSELSFRVGGRIHERNSDVGDHVKAGQVLATLDPDQQVASVTAAEASVQSAQATVSQTSAAYERQKKLIQPGFTTRTDYDQAEEAFRAAQGNLDVAKAQLGIARDQLEQTVLRADADGIITARSAEAGQVVQTAQTVYKLAQDGPRDAVFDVDEAILTHEPDERTIDLSLVADPKIEAKAQPREISPVVDRTSGTVRLKFEIIDPPASMTLGAPVVGTGRFKPRQRIILPWTALSSSDAKPAVWVVNSSTKAVSLQPVEISEFATGLIVVSKGLDAGQMVVSRGGQLLHPNQVVTPQQEARS